MGGASAATAYSNENLKWEKGGSSTPHSTDSSNINKSKNDIYKALSAQDAYRNTYRC